MSTLTWRPADTFGNRLTLVRREKGLTVEQAARRAGVPHPTWSTWEHGSLPRNMALVVAKIAAGLEVDREWLMFGGPLGPSEVSESNRCTLRSPLLAA